MNHRRSRSRPPSRFPDYLLSTVTVAMWIAILATSPLRADDAAAAFVERPLKKRDLEHWAFRPLGDGSPPAREDVEGDANPIDRFILAELRARVLEPLPSADRRTLIRRVSYDLVGLPPTPLEVEAFLEDDHPEAYRRLVDRLLASPRYGERWGQHWLDLARFAESDGYEHDKLRPNAWRYRDWVIGALASDLPYREFVALQLAGDQLRPNDPAAAIATGFTLAGPDMPDINLQAERRHMVLNDITATVGEVFLGLNIGCAQCHDHKSDPINQADFYRLRAYFDGVDIFRDHPLELAPEGAKPVHGRVLREKTKIAPSRLMIRGDFRRPGPELEPAVPRVLASSLPQAASPSHPGDVSASLPRRLALARWITRSTNALSYRVIVNRVWLHHFGEGLVRTPSLFGRDGTPPTHRDLLDWLAREFVHQGGSLKELHRLIVTSNAYRRASRPATIEDRARYRRSLDVDPENRLLARQNRRRLSGEALRDALLQIAGRLSEKREGPGVMPPLPPEVRRSIRKDHWKVTPDENEHRRRSIYLFVRRNLRYPFFEVFDAPDRLVSCARRERTTIAPQSLALLNSELSLEAAQFTAGRVLARAGSDRSAQIDAAFELVLGRPPRESERADCRESLAQIAAHLRERIDAAETIAEPLPAGTRDGIARADAAALTSICLTLLNTNEFAYVD